MESAWEREIVAAPLSALRLARAGSQESACTYTDVSRYDVCGCLSSIFGKNLLDDKIFVNYYLNQSTKDNFCNSNVVVKVNNMI